MIDLLGRCLEEAEEATRTVRVRWIDAGGVQDGRPLVIRVVDDEGEMHVTYARFHAPDANPS